MAGNMPYYNEATCEGHYCAKDCELCPYEDEAMEFCQKLEECEDVPWAWLESYARDYKAHHPDAVWLGAFLEDAKVAFTKEVIEDENDYVESSDDYLEMGFDPYQGCYTDDC